MRWLTHQQRVRDDLLESFKSGKANDFFTESYVAAISAPIKQQEEGILKLFFWQAAIIGFLALGFVSSDSKLSLLGFDLKNVDGLREILLAISSTIALLIFALSSSRDTAILVVTVICEQTQDEDVLPYAKYALPSPFNMKMYLPREYDRWIFSIVPMKFLYGCIAFLLLLLVGIALVASCAVHYALIKEIWQHPGLGKWSTAALVYVFACYALNIALIANRWLPFPYRDQSSLRPSGVR